MRLQRKHLILLACLAFTLLTPSAAFSQIKIVLQNEFIETYKRRVTIDAQFEVIHAHARPNPASKDGDLHIAGLADEVRLPTVAEIMNAKDVKPAVDAIHAVEGTGNKIAMSGAWRIWCEHGGNSEQIQGGPHEPIVNTNPDHVFEIHPVTKLDGKSLLPTLKPIVGYRTKDAHDAFQAYENLSCQIIPGTDTTTIITRMGGFNYVEFVMEMNAEPQTVTDGILVMCRIRDLEGELLVRNRRVVIPAESELANQVKNKPVGTRLHVLGIPRVNLSLVSWRVKAAAEGRTDVLTWSLPYEIIGVGFYGIVTDDSRPQDNTLLPRSVRSSTGFQPRQLSDDEVKRIRSQSTTPRLPETEPQGKENRGSEDRENN